MPTEAQRQKWEASMSTKLSADDYDSAMQRRSMMAETEEDPLMNTSAGAMDATIPGAPGGLLDDTMGPLIETMYQAAPLDLER